VGSENVYKRQERGRNPVGLTCREPGVQRKETGMTEIVEPPVRPSAEKTGGNGGGTPELVARFGVFLLASEEEVEDSYATVASRLVEALKQDARVSDVTSPQLDENWCRQRMVFPAGAERDDLLTGRDMLWAVRFDEPLALSVHVPAKNQPIMTDGDEVPTSYSVLWDGELLLVSWQWEEDGPIPSSGGHIVRDVLAAAAARMDMKLYVQGCSPGCKHDFTHTDLRIESRPDDGAVEFEPAVFTREVRVRVSPVFGDDASRSAAVYRAIQRAFSEFTEMKNLGRRILDVERGASADLNAVLAINMSRADIATMGRWKSVKPRLSMLGWRKESRELIARIWLAITNLEFQRRRWEEVRDFFVRYARQSGSELIYEPDYAGEVDQVHSLDTSTTRSAVQEAASRLDNRALLWGTAFAGAVGGLAGFVGGLIAGG
jgi:hypothetical protein